MRQTTENTCKKSMWRWLQMGSQMESCNYPPPNSTPLKLSQTQLLTVAAVNSIGHYFFIEMTTVAVMKSAKAYLSSAHCNQQRHHGMTLPLTSGVTSRAESPVPPVVRITSRRSLSLQAVSFSCEYSQPRRFMKFMTSTKIPTFNPPVAR